MVLRGSTGSRRLSSRSHDFPVSSVPKTNIQDTKLYGLLDVWVGGATGCPGMKIVYFTLPKYKRRKLFESGSRK